MKALVFLLVLANLLFYAFSVGLIGTGSGDDGTRLGQPLHPERVRIVASGEPPALPQPPTLQVEVLTACLSWPSLTQVEAERVGRVVAAGFPEFSVGQKPVSAEGAPWWVYIPPLATRTAADKKAQELKALGVTDYFIVQEGPSRNAISLGIFSSDKGARDYLAGLQSRGVRSAIVGARPDREGHLQLELRGPDERRDSLLTALAEALPKNPPGSCQ